MEEKLRNAYILSRSSHETVQEWWWATSESLNLIGEQLITSNFVIIDHFLTSTESSLLSSEVQCAYENNLLSIRGVIGGGRSGKDASYENAEIRGDILGYFDGTEENWSHTKILSRNTLICELRDSSQQTNSHWKSSELKDISTRSRAMITCYPGNGSHYDKHCDNPTGNGRKITCILYLNKDWQQGDGGELKIYSPAIPSLCGGEYTIIPPLLNRLVVFWSDLRCLHEVLPSKKMRYALTLWFIDSKERDQRIFLDQQQQQQQQDLQPPSLENENITNTSNLTLLSNHYDLQSNSSTLCLQYPSNNSLLYQDTQLHVSSTEIKIFSSNSHTPSTSSTSMNLEFHHTLSQEINSNQTIAKYSKKRQLLTLVVFHK